MSERGEITESCSCTELMTPCELHPHGVYVCNCGKKFHGHGSRDLHLSQCKPVPPEPTFTLAQVKEIIEGIAVRVGELTRWDYYIDSYGNIESEVDSHGVNFIANDVLICIKGAKI